MKRLRRTERGSALVYILIAIALLAAITIAFMDPSSQQTQSQGTFRTVSDITSQADFIRSAVQECILLHPGGDATIDNTGAGTDPGADKRYPLPPNSTHLTSPDANRQVRNIRCPGNPGDDPNHTDIFAAGGGKFLPPAPPLFGEWQWYNGEDGVFFWIATDKSDAYLQSALDKLNEAFAPCEADKITTSGSNVALDNDGTVTCPSGSTCFRVWMIVDNETTVDAVESLYPDEGATCP